MNIEQLPILKVYRKFMNYINNQFETFCVIGMKALLKPLLSVCILSIVSAFACADSSRVWPVITFTCDKSKNEVKLKNEIKWGEKGERFPFSVEQGTYNPWELVEMEERGVRTLVSEKEKLNLSCELKNINYRFVVSPKIFNPNFKGRCGDRLSVKVSVYKDQYTLLENKDMEPYCHGNTEILRGIKLKGGSNKVKLYKVPRSRF